VRPQLVLPLGGGPYKSVGSPFMIGLVFVSTTECNLSCRHCLRGNVAPMHLPFEIIEKAVNGAKMFGIENIHLTGGEPFLYKFLPRVFELADKHKVPLTFSTNGLFIARHLDLIEKYKKNIRVLNISLESAEKDIHEKTRGPGTFDQVLGAFNFCRAHQVPFGILTCLNKYNTAGLARIVKFARGQKARHVSFTTVLPCSRSRENNLVLSEEERNEVYPELVRLARLSALDYFRLFFVPVYINEPIFASKNIVMCNNQSLRMITVDVEGSVHFCCFLTVYDTSLDVEKRLRVVSLEDVSFDEGVRQFSDVIHRFLQERLEDYKTQVPKEGPDFNSCFYCNKKFGI
jgi:MoaA/NifB/PqqE/SkfB family radical SAM enzyme